MVDKGSNIVICQVCLQSVFTTLLASHMWLHRDDMARAGHRVFILLHNWWCRFRVLGLCNNEANARNAIRSRVIELKVYSSQMVLRYLQHVLVFCFLPVILLQIHQASNVDVAGHHMRRFCCVVVLYFLCLARNLSPTCLKIVYVMLHGIFNLRHVHIAISGERDVSFIDIYGRSLLMRCVLALLFPPEFYVVVFTNLISSITLIFRYNAYSRSVHTDFVADPSDFAINELVMCVLLLVMIYAAEASMEYLATMSLQMENHEQAVSTLLRGLCDGVVKLDPSLSITSLVGSSTSL